MKKKNIFLGRPRQILKSKGNIFAITFKSDNYCYCDSWKSDNYRKGNKGKKQGNYIKNVEKKISRYAFK